MILSTHGVIQSGGVFIPDSDAQAFFDRVDTAGGSLTFTEQLAVNQLVLDMKADGIWTKMKAIYPMVGASAAACAQNLKSSSFTGTFSAGWTFASTGVNGNGSSAYMDTNFNPNTQLTFSDAHISIYKNLGNISSTQKMNGVFDSPNAVEFTLAIDRDSALPRYTYSNIGSYNSPNVSIGGNVNLQGNGFYYIGRNANNYQVLEKNDSVSQENTTLDTKQLLPNGNFWLGATHGVGSMTPTLPSDYRYAFLTFGQYLNSTEASNLYTAVQAFQTTLSRQV